MSIFSRGSALALGVTCLTLGFAPLAQAGTFSNGWNYAIDAFDDGSGGSGFEIKGLAFHETADSVYVALTGGTPLGGISDSGVAGGSIAWGDMFFNFTGDDFQTASDNGSLFGIRFDGANESGVDSLGVFSDVAAESDATLNDGYSNLDAYGYKTQRQKVGEEQYVSHYRNVKVGTEKYQSGTKRVKVGREQYQDGMKRVWHRGMRVLVPNMKWRNVYEERPVYKTRNVYEEQPVYKTRAIYDDVRVNEKFGRSENAMGDLENTSGDVFDYFYGDRTDGEANDLGISNVIASGNRVGDIELLDDAALTASGLDFGSFDAAGPETFGFKFDRDLLPDASFIASVFLECANDGIALMGEKQKVPEPASVLGLVMVGGMLAGSRRLRRRAADS